MAGERTYPVLAVPDLGEALAFYEMLGFRTVMQQQRPNPYAVVGLEDLRIHLSGVAAMDPAGSLGNVIVVVPDADALYAQFASRMREQHGRLLASGIPRLLRPRKKLGTVAGFSVVDPGGNWLRVYADGGVEGEDDGSAANLRQRLLSASRLGDAKDDAAAALKVVTIGLTKFADAPVRDRADAQLYRAELAIRLGDRPLAEAALAAFGSLELSGDDRVALAAELADVREHLTELDH